MQSPHLVGLFCPYNGSLLTLVRDRYATRTLRKEALDGLRLEELDVTDQRDLKHSQKRPES